MGRGCTYAKCVHVQRHVVRVLILVMSDETEKKQIGKNKSKVILRIVKDQPSRNRQSETLRSHRELEKFNSLLGKVENIFTSF